MRHFISVSTAALLFGSMPMAPATIRAETSPDNGSKTEYKWSKPAAGLRVRLFPLQPTYRKSDTFVFRLQFQNVSKTPLMVAPPAIMPVIAPPNNHPYRKGSFDCVITTKPVNGAVCILWGLRVVLGSLRQPLTLAPQGILQFDIHCPKKVRERKKDEKQISKKLAPQGSALIKKRIKAHFALRESGKYEIAGFHEYPRKAKNGGKKALGQSPNDHRLWTGKILIPKVVVEIVN